LILRVIINPNKCGGGKSMAKKKRPIGFETPSMRIQDEHEKILKQLRKKKANWGKILTGCDEIHEYVSNGVENLIKDAESKKKTSAPNGTRT
jgi:hypothetical protein